MFLINPAGFPSSLYSTLLTLGLTTNLKLCLDAGDAESYSGSGQVWADRSGGGYNFNLGSGSGSDGADPTFNGTAGHVSSSEYFSFDGGDYFTLGQSNPSWVQQMHKAGAIFTIAEWIYLNNALSTSPWGIVGDLARSDGFAYVGFQFGASSTSFKAINIEVENATAPVYSKNSVALANNNAWNFVAVSVNMATGDVIFNVNGVSETYASQAYSSPSAASSESTLQIGAVGAGQVPSLTGCRWGAEAMWDRALSAAELTSLYTSTRAKFGV